ncbi:MAG: putative Ig domain-containing protein [Vicinamibacterales bacterium]
MVPRPFTRAVSHPVCVVAALSALFLFGGAVPASAQFDFGTRSVGQVEIPLEAGVTWAPDPGSPGPIPPGLSVREAAPFFSPGVTQGLIGIATAPGTYNFNLLRAGVVFPATMKVVALGQGDYWTLPDAFLTQSYSHQLTVHGNAGAVTWTSPTGLPAGLSLNSSGLISGTPTASGFFQINFTLNDGTSSVGGSVNLAVYRVRFTTPDPLPNATQNVAYNATIAATGGTGAITFAASMPSGLTLDTAGNITGTPTSVGPQTFDVTATDGASSSYTKRFTITIVGVPPRLPRIVPYGGDFDGDCALGIPCAKGLNVSSGGRGPFTWSASGLPPGMTLKFPPTPTQWWVAATQATITGSPTALGTFPVQLTVTDADGATATNTFNLKVSAISLWTNMTNGNVGQPYNFQLRVIGGRLPYTASILSGRLPDGMTLNPTTLVVSGTPTETSFASQFRVLFRFTDVDGVTYDSRQYFTIGSLTTTVRITTGDDLGFFTENASLSRTLSACCVPSYAWSQVGGTLPSGVTFSSGGVLSGTPAVGSAGTYTPRFRVADGTNPANFAEHIFTLVVTPVSFTSASTLPTGNVGTLYTTTLTASGGSGFTYTLEPAQVLPLGLSLSAGGVISGTPTGPGQAIFNVRATNSSGFATVRSHTIAIYPAGINPPLEFSFGPDLGIRAIGGRNFGLSAATGGTPPYTFSLTPLVSQVPGMRAQNAPLPTNIAASPGGYFGVLATPGLFNGSVRVTDGLGNTFDRPVFVNVVPQHILSNNTWPRAQIGVPYSFQLTAYGALAYGWSATGLPNGLTVNASGLISGTPSQSGSFSPTITLTDLSAPLLPTGIGFTLNVNAFAITNGGVLPNGVVGIAYSQTLLAPGCGAGCTFTSTALPAGLSLNSSTGAITGTPTATSTSTPTITATGANGTVAKVFSLTVVTNPAQALFIPATTFADVTVGNNGSIRLIAQGGTAPYTWTLESGTLPAGISIAGPGETLGGTLAPGYAYLAGRAMEVGVSNFTLRVTDNLGATALLPVTWRISALSNQYGTLPLSGTTLIYNTAYSQALFVTGGTEPYTWAATGLPPGLALNPSTGVVSGIPAATGSFTASVTITDAASNVLTTNVSFTVAGTAGPTTLSFSSGPTLGPFQQGLASSTNVNPTGGTSAAGVTITALTPLPPGFALVPTTGAVGNKAIAGIAAVPGTYQFTLMAVDGAGNIGVRIYTMTVLSYSLLTNSGTLPDGSLGVAYSYALQTVAGSPATWSLAPGSILPAGITLSPAGLLSGTPTATGTFNFSLTSVADGGVRTAATSLRISGMSISDAPVLPPAIVGMPYSYTFSATGGGASKVWTTTGLPFGGLSTSGQLTGTPFEDSAGTTASLVVTVNDGGVALTRRFSLPIQYPIAQVLDVSMTNTILPEVAQGQVLNFTLSASGGVAPYVWSVAPGSSLPPGMALYTGAILSPASFAPGTTVLAGSPTTAGPYSFDLIVTDAAGTAVRRTFTWKVSSIGLTSLTIPNATVTAIPTPYSLQFTGVGGTGPYTTTITPTSATQDMLPPGMTLSSGGLLSGAPTSTGIYRFVMTLQDAVGATLTRTFVLNVVNSAGHLISNTNTIGRLGQSPNLTLTAGFPTGGGSTYDWSVVGGALPPGIVLVSDPDLVGDNTTMLGGQPTTVGTFTYTLRATDKSNAANFADHFFTMRVISLEIPVIHNRVGPIGAIPGGQVGVPYTTTIRTVGGTGPYSVAPGAANLTAPGFAISSAGIITGTPVSSGRLPVPGTFSDSAGSSVANTPTVVVPPAGTPIPLLPTPSNVVGAEDPVEPSVGTPFLFLLDSMVSGGVAPLTWSVSAGSLPPGLALFPGGNGVPAFVAGIPTTPGEFDEFEFTVTDASGQTLVFPSGAFVSPMGFSASSIPPATVGTPYSVALGPYGGTLPYTISPHPLYDLPVGMTLNSAGVLSGTPLTTGIYYVTAVFFDGAGNGFAKMYRLNVDNAAGEAPAVTFANPIQISYTQGTPAPSPIPVAINSTSGTHPYTLNLAGAPWANLSANAGAAPSSSATLTIDPTGLAVGTYMGLLSLRADSSLNIVDATPVVLTVAAPIPCSYSVNPVSTSATAGGGSGSFDVSAGSNCNWTASASDPAWITLTGNTSGTGSGSVSYVIGPNAGATERNGSITVGGTAFTITQFGAECSFAINPAVLSAPAAGGFASIAVSASAACGGPTPTGWTATGLSASPATGVGDGSVLVQVPANPGGLARVLNATIAGRTLVVNQAGSACNASLGAAAASIGSAGGSGTVNVTVPLGCDYSTTLGPSWIDVTGGGSGNGSGTLAFTVAANSTTVSRTGTLIIGGLPFQITQDPLACSATLDTTGLGSPYGPAGGGGLVAVTMNGANCPWTASSDAAWASVSPLSSSGNGMVIVGIGSNAGSTTARSAHLTIAGQTIDLTQSGTTCTYALMSSAGSAPAAGAGGSVGIVAPAVCGWTATTNDPTWLTVTTPSGNGSTSVGFVAQSNPLATPRSASLTIAGLTYTVNQAAASCSYTLSSTSTTVVSGGASDAFTFSTGAVGCSPSVVGYAGWLSVSTSFGGSSGTVNFTADVNASGINRIGAIQVDNQTFLVTQLAGACSFSLSNSGALFSNAGAASQQVLASRSALGCSPTVAVDLPTIVQLGPLSGPIGNVFTQQYGVSPFTGALTPVIRRARITFSGAVFVVKQTSW